MHASSLLSVHRGTNLLLSAKNGSMTECAQQSTRSRHLSCEWFASICPCSRNSICATIISWNAVYPQHVIAPTRASCSAAAPGCCCPTGSSRQQCRTGGVAVGHTPTPCAAVGQLPLHPRVQLQLQVLLPHSQDGHSASAGRRQEGSVAAGRCRTGQGGSRAARDLWAAIPVLRCIPDAASQLAKKLLGRPCLLMQTRRKHSSRPPHPPSYSPFPPFPFRSPRFHCSRSTFPGENHSCRSEASSLARWLSSARKSFRSH